MAAVRVGVVGGSGYTGSVAARLVASHPDFAFAFATSDRHKGTPLARHLLVPVDGDFAPNGAALELAEKADAVLLCTSAEVSAMLAPALAERRKIVVDLSGAFRLTNRADYTAWYHFEHPAPSWLGRAHYGLPELFGPPPKGPRDERPLVANPGCYATAALLALAPLVREGLVERAGLIVDGKSGTTGAGRKAAEEHSFAETAGDVRAYKVLTHQHTPEIARMLEAPITFTAHLVPMRRGLVVTAYARPRSGTTAGRVAECLAATYAASTFVHAVAPAEATAKSVTGTNHATVGATANADVVVVVCAIDNLLKGAAGQAIQNLNLACGLPESRGLENLQRFLP